MKVLAADVCQRAIEDLVAAGRHAQQIDRPTRDGVEAAVRDVFGLPNGERALTGGDDKLHCEWRKQIDANARYEGGERTTLAALLLSAAQERIPMVQAKAGRATPKIGARGTSGCSAAARRRIERHEGHHLFM